LSVLWPEIRNSKSEANANDRNTKFKTFDRRFGTLALEVLDFFRISDFVLRILLAAASPR